MCRLGQSKLVLLKGQLCWLMTMESWQEAKTFSKIGNSRSSGSESQTVNILSKDTILPL